MASLSSVVCAGANPFEQLVMHGNAHSSTKQQHDFLVDEPFSNTNKAQQLKLLAEELN